MVEVVRWSRSMIQAWEYALSGFMSGLTQTATEDIYRAAGGTISHGYWATAWHSIEQLGAAAKSILLTPLAWTLREEDFTPINWRLEQKYAINAQLAYFDPVEKEYKTTWRIVEFDHRPTRDELLTQLNQKIALVESPAMPGGFQLVDVIAYERGEMPTIEEW